MLLQHKYMNEDVEREFTKEFFDIRLFHILRDPLLPEVRANWFRQ